MYRVGIVGHRPEYVPEKDIMIRTIDRVIDLISYQYGKDLIINVSGDIGVGHWSTQICVDKNLKYHLFLPCMPDILSTAWYEDQQASLTYYFKNAWATTIQKHDYSIDSERQNYEHIINMSDFVICFWNGMKQGTTYNSIKYAIQQNKLTVNGLEDLKLVTNEGM